MSTEILYLNISDFIIKSPPHSYFKMQQKTNIIREKSARHCLQNVPRTSHLLPLIILELSFCLNFDTITHLLIGPLFTSTLAFICFRMELI